MASPTSSSAEWPRRYTALRVSREIWTSVYARDATNLERLVAALAAHTPALRGAPPGLPFRFDVETLKAGLNFTLTTDLGEIDLLGEISGGGRYEQLLKTTRRMLEAIAA